MSADFSIVTIAWGGSTTTLLDLMKSLVGVADNSRDDELSMYLQMAGEAAEDYIDNKIALQAVTEQFVREVSPIGLRFYPVDGLTTVTLDGVDKTTEWSSYTQDGIHWIDKDCSIKDPFVQLDVTYDAGMEPVPPQLGYAIVAIAIKYEEAGGSASGQVKKEVVNGVGSVEYVTSADVTGDIGFISPSTIGVLERYRRYHA